MIESQGRMFPVETRYLGRDDRLRIGDQVVRAVERALAEESGSLLVFLPGQGEILRTAERLAERSRPNVEIAPLYGALDPRCLLYTSPSPRDRQKSRMPSSA